MLRAFLDGLAAMVGWRVGEAAIRGVRREVGRATRHRNAEAKDAFLKDLAHAARQLPGGTPATAFVVAASSQIEVQALRTECLACDEGRVEISQHRAETIDDVAVRAIDLMCRACASPRTVYFRIERAN